MLATKLRPSSAQTWVNCTASVPLQSTLPPRPKGSAANYGSLCHEVAHIILRGGVPYTGQIITIGEPAEQAMITADIINEVKWYVDWLTKLANSNGDPDLFVFEQRMELDFIIPGGSGTPDAVIIKNNELHVVDYKTGAWPVSGEDNEQLLLYTLGAFELYKPNYNIDNIFIHIYQNNPRCGNNTQTWQVFDNDLSTFRSAVTTAVNQIHNQQMVYKPGVKQCKWCIAKKICPALNKEAKEVMMPVLKAYKDPNKIPQLTIDEAVALLKNEGLINSALGAAREKIKGELDKGNEVPGFKKVRKEPRRFFTNPPAVINTMKKEGFSDDEIAPRELKSPAMIIKLAGALPKDRRQEVYDELNKFIDRPQGEIIVVQETDRRPALPLNLLN